MDGRRRAAIWLILIFLGLPLANAPLARAQSLKLVPFQARLTDGSGQPLPDGNYEMTFVIYDAPTGGTSLWTEAREDTDSVTIVGGQANVLLGSVVPLASISFADDHYLGITINEGQEMVPRHQLVPAFHARSSDAAAVADLARDSDMLGGHLPAHYSSAADLAALNTTLLQTIAALQSQVDQISSDLSQLTSTSASEHASLAADISALEVNFSALHKYGGYYWQVDPQTGQPSVTNPLTGALSCPPGFSSVSFRNIGDAGAGTFLIGGSFHICIQPGS